jgi:hypothetical protein
MPNLALHLTVAEGDGFGLEGDQERSSDQT